MFASLLPPRFARAARRVVLFAHLWTGLLLGLYFVLMGLTGCLLLFENELDAALNRPLFTVQASAGAVAKPLDDLVTAVTARHPGVTVGTITLPQSPDQSLRVGFSPAQPQNGTSAAAPAGNGGGRGRRLEAFVDPYTGAVLGERAVGGAFFPKVLQLHRQFLLQDVGQTLNRYGVLFLIVLLVSGLWLWWPSVRSFGRLFRQRTTVKRGATGHRLLLDLHNLVGFYASLLLLVVTLTGASYFWKSQTVVLVSAVTGTPMVPQDNGGRPNAANGPGGERGGRDREGGRGGEMGAAPAPPVTPVSYATVLANAAKVFPKLPVLQISHGGRGGRGGGGRGGGGLRVVKADPAAYGVRPRLITLNMDTRDGSFVSADMPDQSPLGLRVMNWLMPVHEGQWGYGAFFYVVKVVHCIAGLTPVLLFVTGVLMWANERRAKVASARRRAGTAGTIDASRRDNAPA